MGNVSIDVSLSNIWKSWQLFRRGKRASPDIDEFAFYLERNLLRLHADLKSRTYRHGGYRTFTVTDNKRREISVASVRDRVVHRLLYEYLVPIYDKTFIYDVWSCRKGKGVLDGINRTQDLLKRFSQSFVWRADITKFFDNVNHQTLSAMLSRRVTDAEALWLLQEIIDSYPLSEAQNERERERERVKTRRENSRFFLQPLISIGIRGHTRASLLVI